MPEDHSLDPAAAYGSERWCAQRLGKSYEWFRKARPSLEQEGFPRRDGLVGLTMKADVEAWLSRRCVLSQDGRARTTGHHPSTHGDRYDRL